MEKLDNTFRIHFGTRHNSGYPGTTGAIAPDCSYFSNCQKFIPVILFILAGLFTTTSAQDNPRNPYQARVRLTDGTRIRGLIIDANKDFLFVKPLKDTSDAVVSIDPGTIRVIKLRRKKKLGNGIGIGMMSGLAIAGLIELGTPDVPRSGFNFDFTGYYQGGAIATGLIIGALIGSGSRTFRIQGNRRTYEFMLRDLRNYMVPGIRSAPEKEAITRKEAFMQQDKLGRQKPNDRFHN